MNNKTYDEIWAIEAKQIRAFFDRHSGDVSVIPLPDKKMGSLTLPQTRIIIKGEGAEDLYQRFFRHFMRAGG